MISPSILTFGEINMFYDTLYYVAPAMIALTFILSANNTLGNWKNTVAMMQAKGLPQANLLLFLATLLKYTAGTMMILHFHSSLAAMGLLIFTVLATIIFDNFWSATGRDRQMLYFAFLSNLSVMGGLLLVLSLD
jgi:putative oxidoreductase